jgi:Fe-S-cluster containining protein
MNYTGELPSDPLPFFSDGLRFTCTRCSACCRFDAGYVWLSARDLSRLATGLEIPVAEVVRRYCKVVDLGALRQISLAEQSNMDCIFWRDGACSVYAHRPLQCRSFPFWAPFLESREEWDALESMCPGVNVGEMHDAAEIRNWLAARRWEPPLDADRLGEDGERDG